MHFFLSAPLECPGVTSGLREEGFVYAFFHIRLPSKARPSCPGDGKGIFVYAFFPFRLESLLG